MLSQLSRSVPPEIGVHILSQLSPPESTSLLAQIRALEDTHDYSVVVGWLYARIYGGFSVVHTDNESRSPRGCDFSSTPANMLSSAKDDMFLATTPRRLHFQLARDMREHTLFQHHLATFVQMVCSPWAGKYFGAVPEMSFSLDGEATSDTTPTSMSVAVLNVLVNLTELSHCNLSSLAISKTHIGRMFPQKWEGVFCRFPSVRHLSLRNNAISRAVANGGTKSGVNTKWPTDLRSLCLAENDIPAISAAYLSELPRTLEKLDLSKNAISSFCGEPGFALVRALPNLRELDLSGNAALHHIDASILEGLATSGRRVRVVVRGCKLSSQCVRDLQDQAQKENVVLLSG